MKITRNRKIFIGIIVVIGASLLMLNIFSSELNVTTNNGIKVKVEKVKKGDISTTKQVNGILEANQQKDIYFDSPLKIKKILVKEYQKVTCGQKLIDVDLDNIVFELNQLEIEKKIHESTILNIKALNGAKEIELNKSISEAQSLINISQNDLLAAKALYEYNLKKYNNYKLLFEAGSISKSDFDVIEHELTVSKNSFEKSNTTYLNNVQTLENLKKSNLKSYDSANLNLKMG